MGSALLENDASPRQRSSRLHLLQVAGLRVDLAISIERAPFGHSGAAARLAELLVAARLGCDPHLVRVAALPPSGRPVAMVQGGLPPPFVSLSHVDQLVAAAICVEAPVGLDIVAEADANPVLDIWFTADELTASTRNQKLVRQQLWSAKEAAYKAARIDVGFRPRDVRIAASSSAGFRWSVRGFQSSASGSGVFLNIGTYVMAVAVNTVRAAPTSSDTLVAETVP